MERQTLHPDRGGGSVMRFLPAWKYTRIARSLAANKMKGIDVYPFYASLKLTNKCRFRCKFCNVWRETTPELDTLEMKRVLDNLSESSVILVSFEGGEPLLRPDIGELLEYVSRKAFYLLFTTSERKLEDYPMDEYCKHIDFLHISIDEGHKNLYMFDNLEQYKEWNRNMCVQTVVTVDDLSELEWKVERCFKAGVKIVVMPAVHLDKTKNYFPDTEKFMNTCLALKQKFPRTIISPDRYLKALNNGVGCSSSSIIVDVDGKLFYPCRKLDIKTADLTEVDLHSYLNSDDAARYRKMMAECDHHCGWYQYFATPSFTGFSGINDALKPYWSYIFSFGR
ncbi:MAG: radical SAM protein [candidate division Zixibacteria bacterium]|nr:radical SAM protein [candidate division Zixibacteria bacterium]